MTSPDPGVPRLSADDLFPALAEQDTAIAGPIREHFAHFLPLRDVEGKKTVVCGNGHELRGGIEGFLLGGPQFEWGLAHGCGHCTECGWPMMGHHYIKDAAGKEVGVVRNLVLAIHPDFVGKREVAHEPAD